MQLPPLALLSVALFLMPSAFGDGSESLYDRNLAFLRTTLPATAVLEVRVVEDGQEVVQLWTAEQYAAFRAGFATAMGRDYTAGFQGVPSGMGDQQYLGDIWSDHWGTTRINVATPRCLPRSIESDDKLWIYGGSNARCGVAENQNECWFDPAWGITICSSTFGWMYPQSGAEHGDSWFAFSGILILYPSPFGSIAMYNGVAFAQNL